MRHKILFFALVTFVFNSSIAGLLTLVGFGDFSGNFIFSQCIGYSIFGTNALVVCKLLGLHKRWWVTAVSFPVSVIIGVQLGSAITGIGSWNETEAWIAVVIGLFFGGIGGTTFYLVMRIQELDSEMRERHMQSEKEQMEAHLKMLQAQIEPHFLFNTLANVGSLIDGDPELAKRLLDRLNEWLRIALARARSESSTLGDEIEMLENYLQILKVRFGERLDWQIDLSEEAVMTAFPPMLLQPLVENAVRHGIEPKVGGGAIRIAARVEGERLRIEVSDNGHGLDEQVPDGEGAGLANVRARLATLFGDEGCFILQGNGESGVTAVLELPT